ncbi:MAG: sulfurtransferase [Burkholderiaceae bacterium]|nr:sulfurtransferase [Burkholderiaceae bacterium]
MKAITATELARLLTDADEPPVVLDVREPWELAVASLPDAVAIPMRSIPAALDRLDPQRTTVCMCHHGARSLQVALFLEQHGFRDVVNLTGGIHAWSEQVDSGVPTY